VEPTKQLFQFLSFLAIWFSAMFSTRLWKNVASV